MIFLELFRVRDRRENPFWSRLFRRDQKDWNDSPTPIFHRGNAQNFKINLFSFRFIF